MSPWKENENVIIIYIGDLVQNDQILDINISVHVFFCLLIELAFKMEYEKVELLRVQYKLFYL